MDTTTKILVKNLAIYWLGFLLSLLIGAIVVANTPGEKEKLDSLDVPSNHIENLSYYRAMEEGSQDFLNKEHTN